jgi:DNA-directed RNA polymerase subunit E'/Rpb7
MTDLYQEIHVRKTIEITFSYLDKNIDDSILSKLKETYENKCIPEGFVKDNSIELVKRGNGALRNDKMLYLTVDTLFKCMICNPLPNLVLKVNISEIIKPALIVDFSPLSIIIPKQIHKNKSVFNKLVIGDEIEIKILDTKFKINEKYIQCVAVLNNEKDVLLEQDNDDDLNFELNDDSDDSDNSNEDIGNSLENGINSDDTDDSDDSDDTDDTDDDTAIKSSKKSKENADSDSDHSSDNEELELESENTNIDID